jgi:hypothetical protein
MGKQPLVEYGWRSEMGVIALQPTLEGVQGWAAGHDENIVVIVPLKIWQEKATCPCTDPYVP